MSFPRYPTYMGSGIEWLGDVPVHWKVLPIRRSFQIIGGSTPNSESAALWDGDILWATPADLSKRRSLYIEDTQRKISAEGLESCGTKLVPAGSIILSTRAPIGSLGIASTAMCTNQGCKALVPSERTNSPFFARLLSINSAELNIRGKGTTFLELSGDELGAFRVPVPPHSEQGQIASFLDRETMKIDLLVDEQRRLIDLLSEKRQAVISHAVTNGLNADAATTPSGIRWLGDVPAHWSVVGLTKYLASLVDYRGRTPNKVVEGVFLVTARNIRDGRIDYEASEEYIEPDEYEDVMRRGKPACGDVLFTTEAPLGGVANVDRMDVALAQRIIKFRGHPEALDNYFLKYWLMGSFAQADMYRLATGSTALGIKGSKVGQLRLCLPPLPEQVAIVRHLDQRLLELDSLTAEAERAIDLLLERRSAVIFAAATGKIDVRRLANAQAA